MTQINASLNVHCRGRILAALFTLVAGLSTAGMASAASGDLYISDSTDGIVVKIDSAKTKTIFASGVGQPEGLAFNQSGDLFVADGVSTIYKITPAGTKTVFASGLNAP